MEAHAAGRHYAAFRDALATHFVATARSPEDGFYADPTRLAAACRSAAKIPEKKRRLRVLVELCLWEMREEARVELLFRLVFREPLRRRVRRALASRLGGRGGSVLAGVDFGAVAGAASGEDVLE
jgi:hypothetical protein